MGNILSNIFAKTKFNFLKHKTYYEGGIVVILVIIIGLLLLISQTNEMNNNHVVMPTPTPQPRQTLLYFSPPNLTINTQSPSLEKLNLVIQTNDNSIYGADIELSYDPNIISNLQISSGSFIPKVENLPTPKAKSGTLSYIMVVPFKAKPIKGTGILAQVSFAINKSALQKAKSTQISFLPATSISGLNQKFSVLNFALSEHITYSQ